MNFRSDCSLFALTFVNWIPCRVSFVQTTVPAASTDTPETGNRNETRTVSWGYKLPTSTCIPLWLRFQVIPRKAR